MHWLFFLFTLSSKIFCMKKIIALSMIAVAGFYTTAMAQAGMSAKAKKNWEVNTAIMKGYSAGDFSKMADYMKKQKIVSAILDIGIVPIVRTDSAENAIRSIEAVYNGGIRSAAAARSTSGLCWHRWWCSSPVQCSRSARASPSSCIP